VEERNILFNKKHREEMAQVTDAQTVPVTVLGGHVVVGHDVPAFDRVLSQLHWN
jgi:glutaredoxin